LQKTASYVQWRYLGETNWINLIALVDLKGAKGDKPAHSWSGTSLRFENPNGSYGSYVNLRGPQGIPGPSGSDLPAATSSDVNDGTIEGYYISPRALANSSYFKNDEITTITKKTIGDRLLFKDDMSHELTEYSPIIEIEPNKMQHQNIYIPGLEYQFDTLVLKLLGPIGIGHFQIIFKSETTIFTEITCEVAMHQFWKDDIHAAIEKNTVRMYSIYYDGRFLYIEDKFFGQLP
ncbi:MAG: hypothetical protein RBS19_00330, partial [Bacteroidales bacterium]|nr:hypothetical protein [Bacteroidales bacterium]